MTATTVWSGEWVTQRLGISLAALEPGTDHLDPADLVGLALRRNPKRAHLLVSRVLGKHVPTDPRVVRAASLRLGAEVARVLDEPGRPGPAPLEPSAWRAALAGDPTAAEELLASTRDDLTAGLPDAVVLGFAETATGLGHGVADALGAPVLHSTRRTVAGQDYAGFEEEHSHATGHRLLPAHPDVLARLADAGASLVLVDDELTTGRTVANTIRALHARTRRQRYVVAGLLDARGPEDVEATAALAAELGTRIDVVSLLRVRVELPADVLTRGAALLASAEAEVEAAGVTPVGSAPLVVSARRVALPVEHPGPVTGWAGMSAARSRQLAADAAAQARRLEPLLGAGPVLVLGTEELIHAPLLLATALAAVRSAPVRFSTTTRSPVLALDDPGYALRSSVTFRSSDVPVDGPGPRYAHNVARPDGQRWSTIVLVVDDGHDDAALFATDGPVAALSPFADEILLLVLPDEFPGEKP